MLLSNFEFHLECLNFKLYPLTLFLIFACVSTLSITFISYLSCYELLHFHLLKLFLCFKFLELILSISSLFSTMTENDLFNLHHFHPLDLRFSLRYVKSMVRVLATIQVKLGESSLYTFIIHSYICH